MAEDSKEVFRITAMNGACRCKYLQINLFLQHKLTFLIAMENCLVLPACYLPPLSYFSVIQSHPSPILLEKHEHFPKQTYRTRASIYAANGKLDLIIPVQRGRSGHTPMGEVQISYEWDWQRLHWSSLQTAYRSAAYFEYYEDEFAPFYQQRYDRLFDYNAGLLALLLRLLKIERTFSFTENYRQDYPEVCDFRQRIHPKKPPIVSPVKSYYQVFSDRHGFISDLSIVDLLFNHGPRAKEFL